MAEHNTLTGASLHEPKGASTAIAGEIYIADGVGSGSFAALPNTIATEVIVASLDDLPTPSLGVITMGPDIIYVLDGDINLGSNVLVLSSNTWIKGFDAAHSSLTSSTSGVLFTSAVSFTLSGFAVNCPNGTIFSCTGGSFESTYLKEFTINSAVSLGQFTDWYSLFWDKGAAVSFTNPLHMTGACNIFIVDLVSFLYSYVTAIDLNTATFNTCSFFRCGFSNASATNHLIIAANGANLNAGQKGRINFSNFADIATPISGFTVADVNWGSFRNIHLPNTAKAAQGYLHTQVDTTGLVSNVPAVTMGGTSWVAGTVDQFTITTGGRFTYNGLTESTFSVTCGVVGTAASGTNVDFNHWLYVNGTTKVVESKTTREYNSGAVGSPSPCMAILQMQPGDYLELWVENVGGTQDWESQLLNMKITEI